MCQIETPLLSWAISWLFLLPPSLLSSEKWDRNNSWCHCYSAFVFTTSSSLQPWFFMLLLVSIHLLWSSLMKSAPFLSDLISLFTMRFLEESNRCCWKRSNIFNIQILLKKNLKRFQGKGRVTVLLLLLFCLECIL